MTGTETITIERGIPIPPPAQSGGPTRYPWRPMKIGDSFVWPGTFKRAKDACKKRTRRHSETYRVAKVTEDGKHVIRVWRLS